MSQQPQLGFQNIHESENSSALSTTKSRHGKEELSPSEIGGRVDKLFAALETHTLSPKAANYQSGRKDKWEAFQQAESDKECHSKDDDLLNKNFLQFIISDCCQFLSSNTFAQKIKPLQAKLGIFEGEDSPKSLPALLVQIPKLNQALQCIEYYHKSYEWIHRLLHWPSFRLKVSQMLSQKHRISGLNRMDIHWYGLLFAVCGLGLWNGGLINGEHHQDDLPACKQGRRKLALAWLRCATSALVIGQYDQVPSLDSLRTMSLLLCFPLYLSDKPSIEGAMELTTQTIDFARQLKLDIDPDNLPCCRLSSDVAKDERRRFMMAILCQEFQLGGLFCRKGYLESPSRYILKMPSGSKLYDEVHQCNSMLPSMSANERTYDQSQQDRPTDMHGVISRYRVGQIWQLIGISFWEYQGPPRHQIVLDLDQQLMNVEHEFPHHLKTSFEVENCRLHPPPRGGAVHDMDRLSTYVLLASAHVRLHRPFVIPRDNISKIHRDWHRRRIFYYGRLILTVNEYQYLPLLNHVTMRLSVLAASIALAVLLVTATGDEEGVSSLRGQVYQLHQAYQKISHNKSSLWNRSYQILGVLLETDKARLLNPQLKINFGILEKLLH